MRRDTKFNVQPNVPIQRITDQLPLSCCYKVNGCKSIIASKGEKIKFQKVKFNFQSKRLPNAHLKMYFSKGKCCRN